MGEAGRFDTTRWSIVLAAGADDTSASQAALSTLCDRYWYPLYAFVRRRGSDEHEAQDLTQGFFAKLLEKGYVQEADRQRGRFRTFLITAFRHYVSKEFDRARALKRGGGRVKLPLDFDTGEDRYRLEPTTDLTPERVYERRWALTLLEMVVARVREEYRGFGNEALFEELRPFLVGGSLLPSHREVGERLDMSEGAVKSAAHRLRRRYREALRAEIAETVSHPSKIDEEIRFLFEAVGA